MGASAKATGASVKELDTSFAPEQILASATHHFAHLAGTFLIAAFASLVLFVSGCGSDVPSAAAGDHPGEGWQLRYSGFTKNEPIDVSIVIAPQRLRFDYVAPPDYIMFVTPEIRVECTSGKTRCTQRVAKPTDRQELANWEGLNTTILEPWTVPGQELSAPPPREVAGRNSECKRIIFEQNRLVELCRDVEGGFLTWADSPAFLHIELTHAVHEFSDADFTPPAGTEVRGN